MQRKTGICLIGAGRAGMIHAVNFHSRVHGATMAAVVDVVEESAKSAAQWLGIENYYTDYHDILENQDVDAVVVVSPTDLHKQIVMDCARAKKHIFCEKPMAMNGEECDAMIQACEENGVKLQIGFMRRFDNSFRQAKEMVAQGAIGDLVLIRSNTRGPSKPRPWMYDIGKSNGILAEVNSHDIDSIRWFAESEVESLYAQGANFRNREMADLYPDYYDNVLMSGVFQNGIQFSIDGSAYVEYGYDSKMELVGTKGVLHVGRSEGAFIRCSNVNSGTCTPFINSWTSLYKEAYLQEDTAFVQSIQEDTPPVVTGQDGRMAVKIVEAGNRSIREKSIQKI